MPLKKFEEWRALYQVEPWGEERIEELLANLCHLISVAWSDRVQSQPPREFMPYIPGMRSEPEAQSEDDMRSAVRAINAKVGETQPQEED